MHGRVCKLNHMPRGEVLLLEHMSHRMVLLSNRLKSANELAVVLRWRWCGHLTRVLVKMLHDAAQLLFVRRGHCQP